MKKNKVCRNMLNNPEKFQLDDEKKSEERLGESLEETLESEDKKGTLESFLEEYSDEKGVKELKDFFKEDFDFAKDVRVAKSEYHPNENVYSPSENLIGIGENRRNIGESEENKGRFYHEISHAVIENKYQISKLEKEFKDRFQITQEDIYQAKKASTDKLKEAFKEAHPEATEEQIEETVRLLNSERLLGELDLSRKVILSELEEKSGKGTANLYGKIMDLDAENELIAHAIYPGYFYSDHESSNTKIKEVKEKIEKEGYSPVVEELMDQNTEVVRKEIEEGRIEDELEKEKDLEAKEEDLGKAREEAKEAFDE